MIRSNMESRASKKLLLDRLLGDLSGAKVLPSLQGKMIRHDTEIRLFSVRLGLLSPPQIKCFIRHTEMFGKYACRWIRLPQ